MQVCDAKSDNDKSAVDLKAALQYVEQRHPDRALSRLKGTLSKQPNNIQALLLKAEALLLMERFEEALAAVSAVLKQEPHNCAALVLRSRINLCTGRFNEAQSDANAAIKFGPSNATAYLARADVLRIAQKYKESALDCDHAIQLEPRKSDIWRQSALIRKGRRPGPATKKTFDQAIKLSPEDTRNYDDYADFLYSKRKYEESLPLCNKALQIDPEDGYALMNRAHLQLARKNHRGALADIDKAAAALPWSGWPHAIKGEIYAAMMEDELSLKEYSRAIEIQPNGSQFFLGRAVARSGQRDFAGSVSDLTRAYELGHGDLYAIFLRADVYQALNKYEESLKDLTMLTKHQPEEANHHVRRAIVLKHLNRTAEAEREFTRAIELKPSDMTYERRGDFYNSIKMYDKAVADFTAALKIDPTTKKAQRGLSFAYEGLGRKDLADKARRAAAGDMEKMIDSYSKASDSFSRLKHSLGK